MMIDDSRSRPSGVDILQFPSLSNLADLSPSCEPSNLAMSRLFSAADGGTLLPQTNMKTETPVPVPEGREAWPSLHLSEWADTCATLHMWTQMVGKVRLALSPRINHWWEVPLYVSARGLTTSPIPYKEGVFEAEFDFIDHQLTLATCNNDVSIIPLAPRSVADFYSEFLGRASFARN